METYIPPEKQAEIKAMSSDFDTFDKGFNIVTKKGRK